MGDAEWTVVRISTKHCVRSLTYSPRVRMHMSPWTVNLILTSIWCALVKLHQDWNRNCSDKNRGLPPETRLTKTLGVMLHTLCDCGTQPVELGHVVQCARAEVCSCLHALLAARWHSGSSTERNSSQDSGPQSPDQLVPGREITKCILVMMRPTASFQLLQNNNHQRVLTAVTKKLGPLSKGTICSVRKV